MIEVINLAKQFDNGSHSVEALKEITFSIEDNSFTSIVGVSGCGKTTLLKIISGILTPSSGKVFLNKENLYQAPGQHDIGIVFQEPALLPWRTVVNNIKLPLEILSMKNPQGYIRELITLVGLEGFEEAFPYQLSSGMKARVAIARTLACKPSVLLMDEPFANLDEIHRDRMNLELLRIWRETRTTMVFVTHNLSEAVFLSDRVIVLTPRPAQVKEIINIDLPRQRHIKMKRGPEFTEIVENIREMLM